MRHHYLNPALQRALDVLGLHVREDGDFQLGPEVLTRNQALELVKRLDAGVRIDDMNQAKAFLMGLHEIEADRLLRACLWRFRGKADVPLLHVRSALAEVLGPELCERLIDRSVALLTARQTRGLEP